MKSADIKKKFTFNREKVIQNLIRNRIKHKLEETKEYYEDLEYKFEEEKKRLSKRYNEEIKGENISEEMEYEIGEYFGGEQSRIEDVFLKNLRYSIVVTIYSTLETTLNDLCNYLKRSKKLLLELNEVKGDGIMRAKLYLEKGCLINFPKDSREWKEIEKFNAIRNCIVHAEGNVEEVKSPTKLKNIIKNTDGLSLDRSIERFVRIESAYILSIIDCIEKFIENVHEEGFKTISSVKPSATN